MGARSLTSDSATDAPALAAAADLRDRGRAQAQQRAHVAAAGPAAEPLEVEHPTVLEEPESGGLAGVLVADQGHGESSWGGRRQA